MVFGYPPDPAQGSWGYLSYAVPSRFAVLWLSAFVVRWGQAICEGQRWSGFVRVSARIVLVVEMTPEDSQNAEVSCLATIF